MEIFDLATIKPNASIQIIGKHGIGKTYLIKNIMHLVNVQYKVEFIIICPNAKYNNCYNGVVYKSLYYSLIDFLSAKIDIKENTILVFDNCLSNKKDYDDIVCASKKGFRNIIFSFSIAIYTIKTDLIFCLAESVTMNKLKVYNKYCDHNMFPFDIFNEIYDSYTMNYHALVIHRDKTIKQCCAENKNTYIKLYQDTFLSYDKTVNIIYRIYHNHSMYYQTDGFLYLKLWNNIDFISKCSHILFCFKQLPYETSEYWLPFEIRMIILLSVVELFQNGEFKIEDVENDYKRYRNDFYRWHFGRKLLN
jgi:hypothetical protein